MLFFSKKKEKINIIGKELNIIYAPMNGKVIPLEEVDDPVFSQKLLGEGIAIRPNGKNIYSPVDGEIKFIFPTKHAIGIHAENGADIIIHIGIDTVELNGNGFDIKATVGDYVKCGELIAKIDLEYISERKDPTTMIVLEETDCFFVSVEKTDLINAGSPLIRLGKKQ